jgi:predicted nucleotidyltransferase component of viral defense system
MNQDYIDTARLMTQVAPLVFADGVFALKGGTAINLFFREMPRLSVDLDLLFPDYALSRAEALNRITKALRSSAERLKAHGFQTQRALTQDATETKLMVRRGNIEIKIEVNFVLRGTLYPVRRMSLTAKARSALLSDLELPVASVEDVYGGKLVAAMDRQHPRDLFDVMQLFAHGGITGGIRRAFVVYLACHNRPIHEVLFPALRDIRQDYERSFKGMTVNPVTLTELLETRERLISELQRNLDANERQFLLSLVQNNPQWSQLGFEHLQELPGLRWKLRNLTQLAKANPKKFSEQADALRRLLG